MWNYSMGYSILNNHPLVNECTLKSFTKGVYYISNRKAQQHPLAKQHSLANLIMWLCDIQNILYYF